MSIAELQRKKRKHSKRAAQGTAAAARGQPSQSGASLPPSATPEDQRCVSLADSGLNTSSAGAARPCSTHMPHSLELGSWPFAC